MKSVYQSRAVSYPPELPNSASSEGYPTNGSPTGGVLATVIGDYWYNAVTQEIVNAIKGGGVTPDAADLTQLDAAVKAQIKAASDDLAASIASLGTKVSQVEVVPSGAIMFFPTVSAPNGNWLVCNGRAVSRTAYAALFSAIGTKYGAGNGSTTFALPNLIDRVVWGGQNNAGEYRNAGLPNISGSVGLVRRGGAEGYRFDGAFSESGRFDAQVRHGDNDDWGSYVDFNAAKSNAIYGASSTVQPPALVLLPCIHI